MWKFPVFWLVLLSVVQNGRTAVHEETPGIVSTNEKVESLVEKVGKTGYVVEEHEVVTEDGYILRVHRMFNVSSNTGTKPAVILMHGLLAASGAWVLRGPGEDLAYLLADAGYDVWLQNTRGNTYGRSHTRLSPEQPEFWKFSWHEYGVYDMPAIIDHILAQTSLKKLSLIGHSMGTIVSYALLSIRPEYNEKVNICISLAPIATIKHKLRGLILEILIPNAVEVVKLLRSIGMNEVLTHRDLTSRLATRICKLRDNAQFCTEILFFLLGYPDYKQFDMSIFPVLMDNYPQGTSLDTMEHFRQIVENGKFLQFDFGPDENYARYGRKTPPEYPLNRITAPVMLYHGLNDMYTLPSEIRALQEKLPNVVAAKAVADPQFNHVDFVLARDAKELLYDEIIAVLNKYS